ncbi:MAG: hypothetical protein VB026_01600 [Anaerolineaceae bacterium]|nr:hypothetical protein [Anaerolineaceae bacterium]
MLRLISRILLIAGTVSLVWLVYGLLSGDPIPNYVIIGVLLFILGVLFKDRGPVLARQEVDLPSQRRAKNKHQSWISKGE